MPQLIAHRPVLKLTSELGMNLAGVEKVFELEEELEKMRSRMDQLQQKAAALEVEMAREIENVRKQFRAEIVKYEPPGSALVPAKAMKAVRIPVSRARRRG